MRNLLMDEPTNLNILMDFVLLLLGYELIHNLSNWLLIQEEKMHIMKKHKS